MTSNQYPEGQPPRRPSFTPHPQDPRYGQAWPPQGRPYSQYQDPYPPRSPYPPDTPPPGRHQRKSWPRRHKVLTALGATAGLCLIVIVVVATTSGGQQPAVPAAGVTSAAPSCEATVLNLLAQSATAARNGYSGGLDQVQVMNNYGYQSAVFQAWEQLDGQVLEAQAQNGPDGLLAPFVAQAAALCKQYAGTPQADTANPDSVDTSAPETVRSLSASPSYPTPAPEATGPPGCPGSAALMVAWQAAPASSLQAQGVGPGLQVSGFDDISCWQGWTVADPITNANGSAVFSSAGGLHLLSRAEMQQFANAVCSAAGAPASWKNPAAGPC